MKAIWGKSIPKQFNYSEQAIAKFAGVIDMARDSFKKEFATAIANRNDLYLDYRFNSDDQILWVLESNVDEKEFMCNTESVLMAVLLGAAESDYYYTFEKMY